MLTSLGVLVVILGILLLASEPGSQTQNNQSQVIQLEEATTQIETSNDQIRELYSINDVAEHSSENDCWTIIDGFVYDITEFVANHPGGPVILSICGTDGTNDFKNQGAPQEQADSIRISNDLPLDAEFHSPTARDILEEYKLGPLETVKE